MLKQYVLKQLFFLLVPLMVPIVILGSFSILVTQHFIREDIDQKSLNLLTQMRDNVELILNEMDTLSLSYQANDSVLVRVKSILRSEQLSYEQMLELSLLDDFLGAPANARPYVHSIYVYYDNALGRVLTSTEGLTKLENFYDTDWLGELASRDGQEAWIRERTINRYGIESSRVITIFKNLYSAGSTRPMGLIVLNISPNSIDRMLQDLVLSQEQMIMISDERHRILFQTNVPPGFDSADWEKLAEAGGTSIQSEGRTYAVTALSSDRYGLQYTSLIPTDVLYRVPILLLKVTFALLGLSFIVGILLTYALTRRNYNNLRAIVGIINAAKLGKPIPEHTGKTKDEYGFILQNMVKTFVEQNYLKTQLSERNYRLRYMEMLALQLQINPHFLYNTLEIIYWKVLALTGKPSEATEMIEHLSDILKYALGSPEDTVILEKELTYTEIYLQIQQIRYKDKFDIVWDIDAKARSIPILKLLLQPILENSIYHGIKEKRKKEKSIIKIKVWLRGGFVWIRVVDNGKGLDRERLAFVRRRLAEETPDPSSKSNIGLQNTNKRLQLSYGDEHGLRIVSKAGWGTMVEFRIPAGSTEAS